VGSSQALLEIPEVSDSVVVADGNIADTDKTLIAYLVPRSAETKSDKVPLSPLHLYLYRSISIYLPPDPVCRFFCAEGCGAGLQANFKKTVRAALKKRLPFYMVPTFLVPVLPPPLRKELGDGHDEELSLMQMIQSSH
jgi:hypothetical protein